MCSCQSRHFANFFNDYTDNGIRLNICIQARDKYEKPAHIHTCTLRIYCAITANTWISAHKSWSLQWFVCNSRRKIAIARVMIKLSAMPHTHTHTPSHSRMHTWARLIAYTQWRPSRRLAEKALLDAKSNVSPKRSI